MAGPIGCCWNCREVYPYGRYHVCMWTFAFNTTYRPNDDGTMLVPVAQVNTYRDEAGEHVRTLENGVMGESVLVPAHSRPH